MIRRTASIPRRAASSARAAPEGASRPRAARRVADSIAAVALLLVTALSGGAAAKATSEAAEPYAEILGHEEGRPRAALAAVEERIRAATPEELRAIEERLLATLGSPAATRDARDWAARQLRQAGSERSIPALARLLADDGLHTAARLALQSIPGASVDAALLEALPGLAGDLKAGALLTIGARAAARATARAAARASSRPAAMRVPSGAEQEDRAAVSAIAPLASDPDETIAEAAIHALGRIGGDGTLRALRSARVPDGLRRHRDGAILICAERMAEEGRAADAAGVHESLWLGSRDPAVRTAALRGMVIYGLAAGDARLEEGAASALEEALRASEPGLRAAGAKLACEVAGPEVLEAILAEAESLSADARILLLGMLDGASASRSAGNPDRPGILAHVLRLSRSADEDVRAAALAALGRVGDASSVPLLLEAAAGAAGPAGPVGTADATGAIPAAARAGLRRLRGSEVDAALAAATRSGPAEVRVEALRALAARSAPSAVEALLEAARDPEARVRAEGREGLGRVAGVSALPRIVALLTLADGTGSDAERASWEKTLGAVCRRIDDKDAASAAIVGALAGASVPTRAALLRTLGSVAGPKAREAIAGAIKDPEERVADAAIAALAGWPDASAATDLLAIARSPARPGHRAIALGGLARSAALPGAGGPPASERVRILAEALRLAGARVGDEEPGEGEPDETRLADGRDARKALVAALAEIGDPSALDLALGLLADATLEVDAAAAAVKIAKAVRGTDPDRAAAAVQRILDVAKSPTARQVAESSLFVPAGMLDIAPQGTATSPDGIEKDGAAGGDQAAIDGDPSTYWDEEDGRDLYRLVVTFDRPKKIFYLSIMGWEHHRFAPKDFEVLLDGVAVRKVENAQYDANFLVIPVGGVNATTVELSITGYYGGSPAIRELGIYRRVAGE